MFGIVDEIVNEPYKYLDEKYYNYPEYITDKIEFIYNFAINRNSNIDSIIDTINLWVDKYLDRLFYDMLQRLDAIQETAYSPVRGNPWNRSPQACETAKENGFYWGPFLTTF